METKNCRQKNEEAFNKAILFENRSKKAIEVFLRFSLSNWADVHCTHPNKPTRAAMV
jgi:hypothetical protein